jgi:putative transcriptional regulator
MNFIDLKQPHNDIKPGTGKLLIAEPFLTDPNFSRSVILIAEHSEDGDIGFILNQTTNLLCK